MARTHQLAEVRVIGLPPHTTVLTGQHQYDLAISPDPMSLLCPFMSLICPLCPIYVPKKFRGGTQDFQARDAEKLARDVQ